MRTGRQRRRRQERQRCDVKYVVRQYPAMERKTTAQSRGYDIKISVGRYVRGAPNSSRLGSETVTNFKVLLQAGVGLKRAISRQSRKLYIGLLSSSAINSYRGSTKHAHVFGTS